MTLAGVSKAFVPGVPVLDGVDLSIAVGEIHALLGENGAGKSTLVNAIIGLVRPDAGEIRLFGGRIDLSRYGPAEALARGVGMVHQHSALVPALSAVENFVLGAPRGGLWLHPARARREAADLAERYELAVPLDRRIEDLSVGERQRAEILRALSRGAQLLILDEPTSVLTPDESRRLFSSLRRLRDGGCAVIFISHKLDEVEAVADRVTVLRRGRVIATLGAGEADAQTLGRHMLGRDLPRLVRPAHPKGAAALSRFAAMSRHTCGL